MDNRRIFMTSHMTLSAVPVTLLIFNFPEADSMMLGVSILLTIILSPPIWLFSVSTDVAEPVSAPRKLVN